MTRNYVIERQGKTVHNVLNQQFSHFLGYKEQIVIKSYKENIGGKVVPSFSFFVIIQISIHMCPASVWIEQGKGQLVVILFHILKLISFGFYNYLMTVF